jgi:hypothetical protein
MNISIIAGISDISGNPTEGVATSSKLVKPTGVAVDSNTNIYIADTTLIEKIDSTGNLSILVNSMPDPLNTGPSTTVVPQNVAFDTSGNMFILDNTNNIVAKKTPSGTVSVFAGIINTFDVPTPGPATSSPFSYPWALAVDSQNNLYIADQGNYMVLKVTPNGVLSIFAGTGQYDTPTPGPATSSGFGTINGIVVDSSGNLFIADADYNVVLKVNSSGTLSVYSGEIGLPSAPIFTGVFPDGSTRNEEINYTYISGIAIDKDNNIYVLDKTTNVGVKVAPNQTITPFYGYYNYTLRPEYNPELPISPANLKYNQVIVTYE